MSLNNRYAELCQGFSKLNRAQRLQRLVEMGALTEAEVSQLNQQSTLDPNLAEHCIENAIGYYQLPLGVATNFCIDNKDFVIPMAVEETSIIAALSKTARWIRNDGHITTSVQGHTVIGQVQIAKVKNWPQLEQLFVAHKNNWIAQANEHAAANLVKRGGGVCDLSLRKVDRGDGSEMAVIHVHADCCDAMGANMVIQICEYLKAPIEALTGETVTMCILSNLVDSKLTLAQVVINNVDADVAEKIQEASLFAEQDPYRAATHNKGVLNGIDPVLIATGNDWRAVEAGVHAYACRQGRYQAITTWRYDNNKLIGEFKAPLCVGTVGGMTRLHPTAQMALRMLNISSSNELSRVCAAVGLVQNLGALRALITLGFTEGHMKLHLTNLSLSAGANPTEMPLLEQRLQHLLARQKRVTLSHAVDALKTLRQEHASVAC